MTNSELFSDSNVTNNESNLLNSKYDSWEKDALIKKALAADDHINKLESEHAQLRSTDDTLQEVLKRLEQPQNSVQNNELNQTHERSNSSESLSKDDIEDIVSQIVERKQKTSQAKANVDMIKTKLQEVWGDDYRTKVSSRSQELGIDQSYLESMAESQPQAFLSLILPQSAINPNPNTHLPPSSTKQIEDKSFKGETYKEFREQEKANPSLLYDPKFQKRKLQAAQTLGDAFYK